MIFGVKIELDVYVNQQNSNSFADMFFLWIIDENHNVLFAFYFSRLFWLSVVYTGRWMCPKLSLKKMD